MGVLIKEAMHQTPKQGKKDSALQEDWINE
jgi:hypothetical protein